MALFPNRILKHSLISLVLILAGLTILSTSCQVIRSTGKYSLGKAAKAFDQLPNYKLGKFQNLEPNEAPKTRFKDVWRENRARPVTVRPQRIVPSVQTDLVGSTFASPTVIWFGHSSFLLKTSTANILVDPNFSGYAGPVSWLMKAFEGTNTYQASQMPPIDLLIISHDHYDHLDYETLIKVKDRVKQVVVPKGVGAHLIYWGYKPEVIHELNWDESFRLNEKVAITATTARHTSGRLFSPKKSLWASYVIQVDGYKLYYSGDSGYGQHFTQIGQQYGPFDLALMECGQYGKYWPNDHMFPAQTAQAAKDLGAKMIIPVHWAKFAEANHPWNEPIKQLLPVADSLNIPVCLPQIGQPYSLGHPVTNDSWWETS